MSAIKINESNFDKIVSEEKAVLIDFYADWCGPCKMMLSVIDELAGEGLDAVIGKANVEENPALAKKFGVYSIPTLVVMKDGKEVARSVGVTAKAALRKMLAEGA